MTPRGQLRSLLLGLSVVGSVASALPLEDPLHGFSLDVPANFVRLEPGVVPGAWHAFRRDGPGETWAVLAITPLGGTIAQRPSVHSIVEASAREAAAKTGTTITRFDYRTVTWKGFTLEVMVVLADSPSGKAVSLATQLPLARGAAQVQVAGPAADEARLVKEFELTVASVEGETNWKLASGVTDEQSSFLVGVFGGLGCVAVVGVGAWLLFRKRPIGA